MSVDIESTIAEAQEEFDFDEFLEDKVTLRDRTVTVFLDEVTGEKLGGTEPQKNALGIVTGVHRWGVLGEIDALRADNTEGKHDERILELLDEAEPLTEKLKQSALTIQLHGVPPIIAKDTRRRARATLKIKGKNIPDDLAEEYLEQQQAELFVDCFVSAKNANGQVIPKSKWTVERAIKLKQRIASSEYAKIDQAIGELQYQSAIASSVTGNADFSQGI